MSKSLSRTAALDDISSWSVGDVLSLLRKNGLDECCKVVQKRHVDGDQLLHLTEGKLALWKSDLTRPLTWSLWTFVEELKKSPETYVAMKNVTDSPSEETMSESGSWGTDFEDDVDEDDVDDGQSTRSNNINNNNNNNSTHVGARNAEFHNSLMLFRENEKTTATRASGKRSLGARNEVAESTYTNCETDAESSVDECTYANCAPPETAARTAAVVAPPPPLNVSNLHPKAEKSLAEQLKEQLKLLNARKPSIRPKPKITEAPSSKQPQKSFLHDVVPVLQQNAEQTPTTTTTTTTTTEPEKSKSVEKPDSDLPRPPVMIRNFDLVANLPTRTEESEDEYETFDEQIIEANKRLSLGRVDSKQSLSSLRQNSVESVYKTPSTTSQEKQDEEYEIYECITETPEDNGYYLQPISRQKPTEPPPLPAKPPNASMTPSPTPSRSSQEKKSERSPDKKSATLPHAGSGTSLSAESRATRPLPPPPDKQSYMDSPWFHNVTREQATALIKDRAYGNAQNGYFLLRPSTSQPNNPLALVLWFKDRVYNVPVRKRPDNRYALGSAKVNEQSFASVEDIVKFYSREELVLHTGGVQTGSTKLTDTPPK